MVIIKEIDHSIAYCVYNSKTGEKYIEVNKHLKEDPILYKAVLEHEMQHLVSKNKYMDFKLDFKPQKHSGRLFRWCLKHPESFVCLWPISWEKGKLTINPFLCLLWFIIISIIVIDAILIRSLI